MSGGAREINDYLDGATSQVDDLMNQKLIEKRNALEKLEEDKKAMVADVLGRVILQTIDMFWVDHLEMMEHLRNTVNLRAYGQRDPLVEYKKEGLHFFKNMEQSIIRQVVEFFTALDFDAFGQVRASVVEQAALEVADTNRAVSVHGEVGRNDPCPCGAINPETGKIYKYKNCGLINAPQHKQG